MKTLFLKLAESLLRRAMGVTGPLWTDLRSLVRRLDADGESAEAKHEAADRWLRGEGFESFPVFRRRLIQAAVVCERIREFLI